MIPPWTYQIRVFAKDFYSTLLGAKRKVASGGA